MDKEKTKKNDKKSSKDDKKVVTVKIPSISLKYIAIILGILLVVSVFFNLKGGFIRTGSVVKAGSVGRKLTEIEIGEKGLSYINNNLIATGEVTLVSVEETNGVYKLTTLYEGQEIPIYTTLDGNYMFLPQGTINMDETVESTKPETEELPKSDKPVLELFIMTHCPYGTQAEKGFIPFMESAIQNKVDAKIRFVHYTMHGEEEDKETMRQVCIREEQGSKYLVYLKEFLVAGNSQDASEKAGIDEDKVASCISNGKAEEYYEKDSILSQQYGVQGSPTLIVNGVEYSSGRSADAYLQVACSAFKDAPDECETLNLPTITPNPMWGWDDSSAATDAQC